MLRITLGIVTVLAATQAAELRAQSGGQRQDAKARAIVQRHREAVGGDAAIRSIQHAHTVMMVPMPGGRGDIKHESWKSAPNLVYMRDEMPGLGVSESGYDGRIAWRLSKAAGAMIIPIPPKVASQWDVVGTWDTQPISYAGLRTIGGRQYEAVLVMSPQTGNSTDYFDPKTGLLAGVDFEKQPGPPGHMSMSLENYKRFGRLLYATRITSRNAKGEVVVSRVISVSHDRIDPKRYALPEAVRKKARG